MSRLSALTRREVGQLFISPSLYLVTGFFVLLYGMAFALVALQEQLAHIQPVALFICYMSIFLVPLITMRSFAEERSTGTLELLLTAPVGAGEVVFSKFLGGLVYFLTSLLPLGAYLGLYAYLGDLDTGAAATTCLGLVLAGAAFVAVGVLVSSLTESHIVAAAAACAAILLLVLLGEVGAHGRSGLLAVIGYAGLMPHFTESFARGILDTRDLIYFLTLPTGMLLLTWLVLRARGEFARSRSGERRGWALAAGVLAIGAVETGLTGAARIHIAGLDTAEILRRTGEEGAGVLAAWGWPFLLAALLLAGALLALRHARGGAERLGAVLRRGRLAPSLIAAAALLLILGNINLLGTLRWTRWDLSETGENTLAADTRAALDRLGDRVEITTFFSRDVSYFGPDYSGVPFAERVADLLTEFAAYSPHIDVRRVDALREPERARALGDALGLNPEFLHLSAVVRYGERTMPILAPAMLRPPGPMERAAGETTPAFQAERAFAWTLRRLLDPRRTRVYFLVGHGEMEIEGAGRDPASAGAFARALRETGMETNTVMVTPDRGVPHDCDVLVIAAPRLPIPPETVETLAAYVRRGGRLLALIETDPAQPTRNEALQQLFAGWGGRVRPDRVQDLRNNLGGIPSHPLVAVEQTHPVTRSGIQVHLALPESSSIRETDRAETGRWVFYRLLQSGAGSYRTTDNRKYRPGPHTIGYSAVLPGEAETPEARVVVIGNARGFSNLYLAQGHNRTFATGIVQWLAGRDYRIQVEPREVADRSLRLSGGDQRLLSWVSLVAVPQLWLLAGAFAWWVRRR